MPTDTEDTTLEIVQLKTRLANALASNGELSKLVARLVERNREYEAELDQYRLQAMGEAA